MPPPARPGLEMYVRPKDSGGADLDLNLDSFMINLIVCDFKTRQTLRWTLGVSGAQDDS